MNGYERVAAALRGEHPDRVPVMLHSFMMAAREAGHTMRAFREDPEKLAASFVQSVETYGYDGVLVDVDTATLAGALGVPLALPEDEPALCRGARLGSLAEAGGARAAGRLARPSRPDLARGGAPPGPSPRARGLRPRELRPGALLARFHDARRGRLDDGSHARSEPGAGLPAARPLR